MLALLIFPDWYRILTNPTPDDFAKIGLVFSLLILMFLFAFLSDKLDELNDRKQMKRTAFKPLAFEKQLENEFMFTIGEHK
jgi:uncharacterized membrane protein